MLAVIFAAGLSIVVLAATFIDQTGTRGLAEHGRQLYAPHGEQPNPNLLYGLVYLVAVVGLLLWLPLLRAVQSRRGWAPLLATVASVVTGVLAVLLLVATEYGERIFPATWGLLALLPTVAGIVGTVLLLGRSSGSGSLGH